ncbi:hypothetical protein POTOM_018338 [Populus tomentosa]|uniref:Uncharacterized protein n=4 Tax=Populus TaxID=3689 RepID=A0A8X8D242_POPTO|nr:hypothetical protein POTOM_018338 [Populus tomentosa]
MAVTLVGSIIGNLEERCGRQIGFCETALTKQMEEERKNKLSTFSEEEENDDEDERIEKFFAIIRRLRDARMYSRTCLREQEACKIAKKAKKTHAPVWTPKFQLEDFAEPGLESTRISQPSSSKKERGKEKKEELDLNLTLY